MEKGFFVEETTAFFLGPPPLTVIFTLEVNPIEKLTLLRGSWFVANPLPRSPGFVLLLKHPLGICAASVPWLRSDIWDRTPQTKLLFAFITRLLAQMASLSAAIRLCSHMLRFRATQDDSEL